MEGVKSVPLQFPILSGYQRAKVLLCEDHLHGEVWYKAGARAISTAPRSSWPTFHPPGSRSLQHTFLLLHHSFVLKDLSLLGINGMLLSEVLQVSSKLLHLH